MNIAFLNPFFLIFLPFAAIPIVIHILSKKKYKILNFSYIKFLIEASKQSIYKLKLRDYILLFLRTLLILLLTLTFSRPTVSLSKFAPAQKRKIYVFIDNSYSMSYMEKSYTDKPEKEIQNIAKKVLKLLPQNENISIYMFSDTVSPLEKVPTTEVYSENENIDKLLSSVNNYEISYYPTNIAAVFEYIQEDKFTGDKIVVMISDFTRDGWDKVDKNIMKSLPENTFFVFIDISSEERINHYMQNVTHEVVGDSCFFQINAKINKPLIQNALLKFYILPENKIKFSGAYNFASHGEHEEKIFNCKIDNQDDIHIGYFELEDDRCKCDNFFCYAMVLPKQPRITIIDGSPGFTALQSETYYFNLLFSEEYRRKNYNVIRSPNWENEINFENTDILIFANVEYNEEKFGKILDKMLEFIYSKKQDTTGKAVIFSLGDKVIPEDYNNFICKFLPVKLDKVVIDKTGIGIKLDNFASLFSDIRESMKKVKIYKYITLLPYASPTENGEIVTLLNLENNDPLLLEYKIGKDKINRVIVYTTTLDADWNNFPLRAGYLPFWYKVIRHCSPLQKRKIYNIYLSSSTVIPLGEDKNLAESAVATLLFSPAVAQDNITGKTFLVKVVPGDNKKIKMALLNTLPYPGIYKLTPTIGNRKIDKEYFIVANVPTLSGESDFAKLDIAEVRKLIKPRYFAYVSLSEKGWDSKIKHLFHGKEITSLLWKLLFFVFILEFSLVSKFDILIYRIIKQSFFSPK